MSLTVYLFVALVLAGAVGWQLASGVAVGAWWYPRVARRERPTAYWLLVAAQGAIFVAFVLTGRTWHTH